MLFNQVDHLAIICHDEQAALHFYVDQLGFTVKTRDARPEKGDILFHLASSALIIELFIKPTAPQRVSNPEALGLRHLSFKVANVKQAVADLAARGIECEPIRRDTFTNERMTFFHDPDGLPLEIHE
ncbi:VOC family protein [Ligilactobacillus pabuli]|uniref:VOC family protein n=1 Tax=Ligilactobacillus pabuli TaxID=2886039 RepID=A0ABQ5JIU4_9LACO|nr:VOC family protein [Ligilactobacillus pabuli]GKS81663.1 VOC family protein [Ligilactobacillus pabuli]